MRKALLVPRARGPTKRCLQPAGHGRTLADFSSIYRAAARTLAGTSNSGSIEDLPALFLYRHALETAIKAVLIQGGEPENTVLHRGHDLLKQMPDLRKTAERRGLPITGHFESMIDRWKETDPDGMTARYPTDRNGKRVLIANESRFHLRQFVKNAEKMLDELDELLADLEFEEYLDIVARET